MKPSHHPRRARLAILAAATLTLVLLPTVASAAEGSRSKVREAQVRSRSGGEQGSSSRGSSASRSRSIPTKPSATPVPHRGSSERREVERREERHDDRDDDRGARHEGERRTVRVAPSSGTHGSGPNVGQAQRRDDDPKWGDRRDYDGPRGSGDRYRDERYRDHHRQGDRGTRWQHPRYSTYRNYARHYRHGHPGSYYRNHWPRFYVDVWGYDHDPYGCHHDHFGYGSVWSGYRDFRVPQILVRIDTYRDHYYGRYWHSSHGHHHSVYRFPSWEDGDYYYRPYAYCDGHLYDSGYFTVEGPRFGLSVDIGW